MEVPELERAGEPQEVLPVAGDALGVDAMAGERVQPPIVGAGVDAPETGAADVGEPGAELVAQEPEQAEDAVGVGAGVGHDLGRLELGLLAEQEAEDDQAVLERAGDDDGVEPGELVGHQVVVGDAAPDAEVARVGSGVDGPAGDDEAHPVGGSDLAMAPEPGDRQRVLGGDHPGVGGRDRLVADEILRDPRQPGPFERRIFRLQ